MLPVWVTIQLAVFGYFIAVIISFLVAYKSDKAYKKSITDFIRIHAPLELFVVENDQTKQQQQQQKKSVSRQNTMTNYTQKPGYLRQNKPKSTLLLTNGHQNHSTKSDYEEYDDEESFRSIQKKPLLSLIKPIHKKKLLQSSSSSSSSKKTSSSSSVSSSSSSASENDVIDDKKALILATKTDGYNYMADLCAMINEKNKKVIEVDDDDENSDNKENEVAKKFYKKSTSSSIWGYRAKNSRVLKL